MKTILLTELHKNNPFLRGGEYFPTGASVLAPEIFGADSTSPKSGGIQFRFITNSNMLSISFETDGYQIGNYPNLGITAQSGLSILYRKFEDPNWYPLNCISSKSGTGTTNIDMTRFGCGTSSKYEILIYSPIRSYLKKLEVSIEDDAELSPSKQLSSSLLCLGGINTFGIGCTASSMMLSNILGRKFDYNVYNVSFDSNDYLQKIYAILESIIKSIQNIKCVILEGDYIRQKEQIFNSYFPLVVMKLSTLHCPVYIWSSCENRCYLIKKYTLSLENLVFVETNDIFKGAMSERYMHSANFINDFGNIRLYEKISELLNRRN